MKVALKIKKKGNKLQSNAVIEQSSASNDIQERLSDFQFLGALPTAELISEIGTARYEGKSLDVNIQVFDELTSQVPRTPIIDKTVQVLSFEIPQTSEYVRWPVTGFGYKLQFRGPDVGGLSGCAPEAPRHYSLELFKSAGNGRYNYIANYHIAIWRANGRICFALANNYGRPRCFKTCTPSYNDIRSPIQQALSSNGVNSAVASALAATMAALIIGSIFVLAL